MANLKEIRTRITSVSSTRQITSAMKMVSAAKLRRAQDAILRMRPYALKLQEILRNLSESLDSPEDNRYGQHRELKKVLIVVISSNRGLCGGFNSNITKKVIEIIHDRYSDLFAKGNVDLISFGKKSGDMLRHKKITSKEIYPEIYENLSFENVSSFATRLMDRFTSGEYDRIDLVYNHFRNAAIQIVEDEQFLPVKMNHNNQKVTLQQDYIFEPNKSVIVSELIPKSLRIQFYKAILDSHAAEHGARMTAMHKATDNATEILRELKLNYNKARQSAITSEILEIVSGAEALKG
jgi:F-type H+-transporting ATPase subunit gamma